MKFIQTIIMNCIKKIFITTIVTSCFLLSHSIAADIDCAIFANDNYNDKNSFTIVNQIREDNNKFSNFLTTEQKKAIIDKESLNTAILNLKKYCCEHNIEVKSSYETCKKDKVYFNDNTLDSQYLFDHIYDVIMRRLSGMTGAEDIYETQVGNIDSKGQEWREWINEKAENLSGSNPQEIINKTKEYRNLTQKYNIAQKVDQIFTSSSTETFLLYVSGQGGSEESKEIANAFQEYEQRTLYDKYKNSCITAEVLYSLLNQGKTSEDIKHTRSIITKGKCSQIASQQIQNENNYTKEIIQQSSNLFIENYIQDYLSYLNNRLETLQNTRKESVDKRTYVTRAVPQLVKTCKK